MKPASINSHLGVKLSVLIVVISIFSTDLYAQRGFWGRNRAGAAPARGASGGVATQVEVVSAGGYQMLVNPNFAPLPGTEFTQSDIFKTISPEELDKLYEAQKPESEKKKDSETPPVSASGLQTPVNAATPDTVSNSGSQTTAPAAPQPSGTATSSKETSAEEKKSDVDPLMKYPQGDYKLGFPDADKIVKIMESELRLNIKNRAGVQQKYDTWINYLKQRTAASARSTGTGGYNGICRLKWYEELLLDPLTSAGKTEEFSRFLHAGVLYGGTKGYGFMLKHAREKMGVPAGTPCETKNVKTPEEAYKLLALRLGEVKGLHAQAVAPITPTWLKTMNAQLYNLFTIQVNVGHTINLRSETIRQIILNFEKFDYGAYYDAAGIMLSFSETDFLDQLLKLDSATISKLELIEKDKDGNPIPQEAIPGVTGEVLMVMECPAGKILVGGKGDNVYDLERLQGFCAIIDLGGNDTYKEGMVSMNRPVLLIIDEDGDDVYTGKLPAIQGSSILGVSCLIDRKGNDTYQAQHIAQGSTLCGVGILLDMGGNDTYSGVRRVQGTALAGIGLAIDLGGNDSYHAAMWAQGLGHPKGFGMLDNVSGDDKYYLGGIYPDSYDETPGYEGWGQGLGCGLRDLAGGGVGVLLEGGGDDYYEYDYIAHGGGYWQGVGILRDFSGNDNHAGPTTKAFNGGQRTQQRFQRLGNGFGCHYAVGYLFEDFGDDTYHSTIMNNGFGWDASHGWLLDFQGNDKYTAVGGGSDGNGAQAAMGVLFDYDGNDVYYGTSQGYASISINPKYHVLPQCGGNFAFVIDYGGTDAYGCRVRNNGIFQRGAAGGYIIDRPVNPKKTIPAPK